MEIVIDHLLETVDVPDTLTLKKEYLGDCVLFHRSDIPNQIFHWPLYRAMEDDDWDYGILGDEFSLECEQYTYTVQSREIDKHLTQDVWIQLTDSVYITKSGAYLIYNSVMKKYIHFSPSIGVVNILKKLTWK